jgi:hypothetical protein
MTAWIALIIAAGSLSWNIVSTVYSWRRSRIKVEIKIAARSSRVDDEIGHLIYLDITAVNRGGAPVAITAVGVGLGSKWGWRYESSPTRSLGPFGIVGSELPVTIAVNHELTWALDLAFVIGNNLRKQERIVTPYVQLSGGQIISKDYTLLEEVRQDALKIFELRHNHHEKGATSPSAATQQNCPYCQLQANSVWPPTVAEFVESRIKLPQPKPARKPNSN